MRVEALQLGTRYAKIASEVGRQVYTQQKLSPPDFGKLADAQRELGHAIMKLGSTAPADYTLVQVARFGLLGVELAGFYTVGKIFGKGQIVGYKY